MTIFDVILFGLGVSGFIDLLNESCTNVFYGTLHSLTDPVGDFTRDRWLYYLSLEHGQRSDIDVFVDAINFPGLNLENWDAAINSPLEFMLRVVSDWWFRPIPPETNSVSDEVVDRSYRMWFVENHLRTLPADHRSFWESRFDPHAHIRRDVRADGFSTWMNNPDLGVVVPQSQISSNFTNFTLRSWSSPRTGNLYHVARINPTQMDYCSFYSREILLPAIVWCTIPFLLIL